MFEKLKSNTATASMEQCTAHLCNWLIGDECCYCSSPKTEVGVGFPYIEMKKAQRQKRHKSVLMQTDRQDREAVLQNRQTGRELVRGRLMGRRDIMTTESG